MEYTSLGRTGLKVSRLILGTMNFGPTTAQEDCPAIMDRALELGINFIDTADIYGFKKGEGWTEKIIGKWLAQGGARRDKIVLATKAAMSMGDGPNEARCSAYYIKRACEDSLRRLGVDHIDLYQIHHIDRDTPWEELWQALDQLVRQGKVIYTGSSNFAAWHIATANQEARRRNLMGFVSEQCIYNLHNRNVEMEVLPACAGYGMGVILWSPLEGGMLAGALKKEKGKRRDSDLVKKFIKLNQAALERYETLCDKLGEAPANVALAWLLAQPTVTGPIIGPRTIEQLESTMRVLEIQLDDATLKELDEIWPGPGGAAPESYYSKSI